MIFETCSFYEFSATTRSLPFLARDVVKHSSLCLRGLQSRSACASLIAAPYTRIYAPVGGIISNKSVEVGERIESGQQLLIVRQIDDIWITANFKETQLRKMHPGQPVKIHVDTFGQDYKAYVENMPGATGAKTGLLPPENATGNYVKIVQRLPVRIRLYGDQDQEHQLRPGMSVEPKVYLK